MSERAELLEVVAAMIADYRREELDPPTADHVDRWISQFPSDVQVPLLWELWHVLERTYLSKAKVLRSFDNLLEGHDLAGTDPARFWRASNFLRIQQRGRSQEELLGLFDDVLHARFGLRTRECGEDGGPYIYLDDVVFSGGRVRSDLVAWVSGDAPSEADVRIVVLAAHEYGVWDAQRRLEGEAVTAGKRVTFTVHSDVRLENRRTYRDLSQVLWPAEVPDDPELRAYIASETRYPFVPRCVNTNASEPVFSSEEGRRLLERELLMAGVRIRGACKNPIDVMRPLGFSNFGLGFGSMIVTFRNCPNNTPLALWWGDPASGPSHPLSAWYPLFSRKTYLSSDASGWYEVDEITW